METVVYLKVPAFPAGPLFRGSAFCQVQGSIFRQCRYNTASTQM